MFCLYPGVWFTTCFALCDDIFYVSMLAFFFHRTFACLCATCYILVCNLWHISSLSLRVIYDMLCFMRWYYLCLFDAIIALSVCVCLQAWDLWTHLRGFVCWLVCLGLESNLIDPWTLPKPTLVPQHLTIFFVLLFGLFCYLLCHITYLCLHLMVGVYTGLSRGEQKGLWSEP